MNLFRSLKIGLGFAAGAAAFALSVGVTPPEIGASKQSSVANLPTVSISAGEQAKAAYWEDRRTDSQRGENLRLEVQKKAGFCGNISDEVNAANRWLARRGWNWRYKFAGGLLFTYGW